MLHRPDHGTPFFASPLGVAAEGVSSTGPDSGPKIGAILRAEREQRGWALTDVAEFLRIRRVMLEALENGRYEVLPGNVYVTAFLRTYGELLGFDPDLVIERYRAELEAAKPVEESRGFALPIPHFSFDEVRDRVMARWATIAPHLPQWSPRAAVAGVGLLAVVLGGWMFSGASAPEPARQMAQRPSPPVIEPATTRPNSGAAPLQSFQNPSAAYATPAWAGPGGTMPAAGPATPAQTNVAAAPAVAASRISVRATERTFVEIRDSSGTSVVARELRRGTSLEVPNQPGLVLTSARLNNLEFLVDGRLVASQARQGRRDVQLDPDRLLRSQVAAPRRDRPPQPQQQQQRNQGQNQNRQQQR